MPSYETMKIILRARWTFSKSVVICQLSTLVTAELLFIELSACYLRTFRSMAAETSTSQQQQQDNTPAHRATCSNLASAATEWSTHVNEVTLRRARLVLGWVTVSGFNSRCGTFTSVCDQSPRSTQPGHPFVDRRMINNVDHLVEDWHRFNNRIIE